VRGTHRPSGGRVGPPLTGPDGRSRGSPLHSPGRRRHRTRRSGCRRPDPAAEAARCRVRAPRSRATRGAARARAPRTRAACRTRDRTAVDRGLGVHAQQIRGSGSPASMSTTPLPPNAVSRITSPGGSGCTSAITAASAPRGCERSAASASSALGCDDRQQLALVCDVEGVEPEDLAGPVDGRGDWQRRLVDGDREL